MNLRIVGMILLIMMGIIAAQKAQADAVAEAGLPFLKIVPGARPAGMGEAFVAQADDATATWWNPGGMAFIERRELATMYYNLLPQFHMSDLYYMFLSYVHGIPEWGTVGGNITFLNAGGTEGRDENNQPTGVFYTYEVAFTAAYGSPVNNKLGVGVATKFVYSHLSDQGAGAEKGTGIGTTMAVDLGVMYRQVFTKGLTLAATLTNMGPAVSYIDRAQADPLPMSIRVGASYQLLNSEFNRLTANLDFDKELVDRYADYRAVPFYIALFTSWTNNPWENEIEGITPHVGLEYWYSTLVGLRMGYYHDQLGKRYPLSFGFSIAYSSYRFDFGYLSAGESSPLNDTMLFTVNLGL